MGSTQSANTRQQKNYCFMTEVLVSMFGSMDVCCEQSILRNSHNPLGLLTPGTHGKISPTYIVVCIADAGIDHWFFSCIGCQRTELRHDALGVNTKCLNAPGVFRPKELNPEQFVQNRALQRELAPAPRQSSGRERSGLDRASGCSMNFDS